MYGICYLVISYFVLFRTKEAQEVYERALFYDSTNPDIYYNVSMTVLVLFLKFLFLIYM